tara:strand:+ start:282 stop:824 length:543 start_codon:yes stop_codon:yes gene_type:complete
MKKSNYFICSLFCMFLFSGCSNDEKGGNKNPFKGMSTYDKKRELEGALKRSAQKEHLQIDSFLKRHNIVAKKTGTGVRYAIYQSGNGKKVEAGDYVEASYVITNIKGDTIYTVNDDKPVRFQVEKSEKESGLHEAIKFLSKEAQAIIVLPSYRAHGVSGDDDKIPPLTTVVYNIKLHRIL